MCLNRHQPFRDNACLYCSSPSVSGGRLPEIYSPFEAFHLSDVTAPSALPHTHAFLYVFIPTSFDANFILATHPAMYPVGAVILLQLLWEHELPSSFALVTLGVFLSMVFLCRCSRRQRDTPTLLPRFFLFNTLDFFRRRYDFFIWGFQVTGQRLFQFRLLRVRSGEFIWLDIVLSNLCGNRIMSSSFLESRVGRISSMQRGWIFKKVSEFFRER